MTEAMAKRRLADEYDAAQERGEVKAANNAKTNSNVEAVSAAALGLTHKDIHEARQIRDAEEASPGIVRQTLDAALDAGTEPNQCLQWVEIGHCRCDYCTRIAGESRFQIYP